MEKGVVVLVTGSKGKEVFACFRAQLAEELYFYVAVSCVESE